jgi:hypothetical protein
MHCNIFHSTADSSHRTYTSARKLEHVSLAIQLTLFDMKIRNSLKLMADTGCLSVGRDSLVYIMTELWAERSEDRNPVKAGFSALVQTGPGAHTATYTMGTRSLSRG